jgi:hypothetical protein
VFRGHVGAADEHCNDRGENHDHVRVFRGVKTVARSCEVVSGRAPGGHVLGRKQGPEELGSVAGHRPGRCCPSVLASAGEKSPTIPRTNDD